LSDPLEDTGLDELREIVGRLRPAHMGELLISAASQFCHTPVAQDGECAALSRLEFFSGGNWRHPLTPRPISQAQRYRTRSRNMQVIEGGGREADAVFVGAIAKAVRHLIGAAYPAALRGLKDAQRC
jgi:hypothetical protein